ncbi:hypothetical protein [Sphingomonas aracearum]|uniref:hypothetical protein n=1 Tax=Sphingomonas aracearum TaxID=2283317 RepID=UPI0011C02F51|nr:hypothetical protein [Sphingomonas aracearum]
MGLPIREGAYGSGVGVIGGGLAWALPDARFIGWLVVVLGVGILIWGIWRQEQKPRTAITPIGLDDALRYLARDSAWSCAFDKNDPAFSSMVARALLSALSSGDLRARGRYYHELQGGVKSPPLHPRLPIDPGYWRDTNINAWWALNDQGQRLGGVVEPNGIPPYSGSHEGLHDVRLDRDRLRQIWPPADR